MLEAVKILQKLETIEPRELTKLCNEIPELNETVNATSELKNSPSSPHNCSFSELRGNSNEKKDKEKHKSHSPSPEPIKSPRNKQKTHPKVQKVKCNLCLKEFKNKDELSEHWSSDCPLFTQCEKCEEDYCKAVVFQQFINLVAGVILIF